MPGMDCGIDRILNYVSCYSTSLDNKKETEAVFTRLIDDVQAALLSGSWRSVEGVPDSRSIREYQLSRPEIQRENRHRLSASMHSGHTPFVLRKSFRMDGLLDSSGDETSDKCAESERSS
jgi:hypothetical protein